MTRPVLIVIAVALVVAGVAAAIAGCVPYDRLQSAGALVRRAEDFTPERFSRFRHVCWFFAAALPALAGVLYRNRVRPEQPAAPESLADSQSAGEPAGWLLWLIVAVAVGLRLQRWFDPVAYDEAYTYLNFASRPWYEAIGDYNSTNNHLLNTLLMHVSTRVFGPQEWAMRWHVLLAGAVLPWAAFRWLRDWFGRPAALLTAAAVAVSPMLITYSTDARGYMLVALAAILFDASLARLAAGVDRRAWWTAWGALVGGLCSMPLMVYAAAGSAAWFVLLPLVQRLGGRASWQRVRELTLLGGIALPVVVGFHTPAYIFRGLAFLSDPIVRPEGPDQFLRSLATAWQHAFDWWTDGALPGWLWGVLAVVGLIAMPDRASRVRWGLPFAVVLVLNVAQHVAPPPRIYMHLTPWLFAGAALGLLALLRRTRSGAVRDGRFVAVLLLVFGGHYAFRTPVLFHASERSDFASVPAAIEAVHRSLAHRPGERGVLLAPLPCDLPSIFYLRRAGIDLPVNVRPQAGDRVFLISRPRETPKQVLATPLLDMADLAPQLDAWLTIEDFETLTLQVATFPATADERVDEAAQER